MASLQIVDCDHDILEYIVAVPRYLIAMHFPSKPLVSRVYENLYVGGAPRTSADVAELATLKIKAVVTVQMDYELRKHPSTYGAHDQLVLRVPDTACPTERQYGESLRYIRKKMAEKWPVYVHCNHGHGRSVAVILRFLEEHNHMSPDVACKLMKRRRDGIKCKCTT